MENQNNDKSVFKKDVDEDVDVETVVDVFKIRVFGLVWNILCYVHGPGQGSKSRKISYRAFVHDFVRRQNIVLKI